jgi:arsenate reductase
MKERRHDRHHLRHQELRHDEEGAGLACRPLHRGEFHDYKASGIDRTHLERWCAEAGWETVLNRAGTTFRKLDDEQKQDLDADKAIALMLAQPSMIKRPVLEADGRIIIGFKPDRYEQFFA